MNQRRRSGTSSPLLAAFVGVLFCSTVASTTATWCGNDHEHIRRNLDTLPVDVIPQLYAQHSRRLVDQDYGAGFVNASTAVALGIGQPIRITLVWDVVDGRDSEGLSTPRQCMAPGDTIQLTNPPSGTSSTWSGCSASDVVNKAASDCHPGTALLCRYLLMKKRTEWAKNLWEGALHVRPVKDNITIAEFYRNSFNLEGPQSYSDTDLVIIMTARPEPFANVAGYATCLQKDQFSRCTVGQFNWVPEVFDLGTQRSPDTISSDRHTAVHEIIHILGGMSVGRTGSTMFRNDDGSEKPISDLIVQEQDGHGYPKVVTKVKTPKVLAMVREHFECPTMTGMPLEDIPIPGGFSSHWEARLMGPEVMSYGTGSGESYLSDLTLAFLEDSNQYVANYTVGGRLLHASEDDTEEAQLSSLNFLRDKAASSTDYTPPPPRSPGSLRWGRGQGCTFVHGNAREWSSRYRCSGHQVYGCSYDNRMSAVCSLRTSITVPRVFSCGGYDESTGSGLCNNAHESCTSSNCPLPQMYQYFTAASAADAASGSPSPDGLGGWSDAMDFVPTTLSYWNCQDSSPAPASSIRISGEGSQGTNYTQITEDAFAETELFGGQDHCPTCRCFISSLMDLTKFSVNPRFPRFGLCYRSNCYRPDYLQVAIKNSLSSQVNWYKCPSSGGKLYIPGFTGAFHCPNAVDFCRQEEITGVKYPETLLWWEWVFWGLVIGIPFVIGCVCLYDRPRHCIIRNSKKCCGVTHFALRKTKSEARMSDSMYSLAPQTPPRCPALGLFGINVTTALFGIAGTVGIYIAAGNSSVRLAAAPYIALTVLVASISGMGMIAAFKKSHGASCVAISYYYVAAAVMLVLAWGITYALAFQDSLETYVDRNWDVMSDMLSCCYDKNANRTVQIMQAAEELEGDMSILAGLGIIVEVLFFIGLLLTAKIVSLRTLAGTTFTVINYVAFTGAVILAFVAYYLDARKQGVGDASRIVSLCIGACVYLGVTGILGVIAAFKKRTGLIMLHAFLSTVMALLSCWGASYVFGEAKDADRLVDDLSIEELRLLAEDVHTGLSREEMIVIVRANLRQLAMLFVMVAVVLLLLVASAFAFVEGVRTWEKEDPRRRNTMILKARKRAAQRAAAAAEDEDLGVFGRSVVYSPGRNADMDGNPASSAEPAEPRSDKEPSKTVVSQAAVKEIALRAAAAVLSANARAARQSHASPSTQLSEQRDIGRRVTPVLEIDASTRSFDMLAIEEISTPTGVLPVPFIRDASGNLVHFLSTSGGASSAGAGAGAGASAGAGTAAGTGLGSKPGIAAGRGGKVRTGIISAGTHGLRNQQGRPPIGSQAHDEAAGGGSSRVARIPARDLRHEALRPNPPSKQPPPDTIRKQPSSRAQL